MQVKLVYFRPDGGRKMIEVPKMPAVIGRGEDCAVRAPVGGVSRRHCELLANGDALALRDLQSSNGTYVNGNRVSQAELSPGDVIKMGDLVLTVQIDGQPDNPAPPAKAASKPAAAAKPAKSKDSDEANVDDYISMMFDDEDDEGTEEIDPIQALEEMDEDEK